MFREIFLAEECEQVTISLFRVAVAACCVLFSIAQASAEIVPDTEKDATAIEAEMHGYTGYLPLLAVKLARMAVSEKGQHDLSAARKLIGMARIFARMRTNVTVPWPLDAPGLAGIQKALAKARQAGAVECAPEEMASAQASLYLLAHELSEGSGEPTEQTGLRLKVKKHAQEAYRLTVRRKCTARKLAVIGQIPGVNFALDSFGIKSPYRKKLDQAIQILKSHPGMKLELAGHTCWIGPAAYNQRLSERRAQSVFDYLVSKGVSGARLTPKGYGESRPVADNHTEAGRIKNRRVELRILRK